MGIVQEIEIRPHEQVIYAQPRICPGEWDAQSSVGFWDTNGTPNLYHMTRLCDSQQKKWPCQIVEFALPADHRIKIK